MPRRTPSYVSDSPTHVVVFLSGRKRGRSQHLVGRDLHLGTAADNDIQVGGDTSEIAAHHAVLRRQGEDWELEVVTGGEIWVNGEPARRRTLVSGDLIEVGRGGPVMRYRVYPPGQSFYRGPREVFADCVDSTRAAPSWRARLKVLGRLPRDVFAEASPRFQVVSVSIVALLAVASLVYSLRLEKRIERETLPGIAQIMSESEERGRLTLRELETLRSETESRFEELEARSGALAEVIAQATPAIVFLQGSYGFEDPASGRLLRFALGPDHKPMTGPAGEPMVTLDGDGPVIESLYTGTGFVVTESGLVLTNRHVGEPWRYEKSAQAVAAQGHLRPTQTRFVGYLPGRREPFDLTLEATAEKADLALLRSAPGAVDVEPLRLSAAAPTPGDEVVVLGYPTGVRALLARVDEELASQLMNEPGMTFWRIARRLAERDLIAPLATRGIVGQVTNAAVVYDAETTGGGSGGPVLGLDGTVLAVNTAILTEFSGSNMGIPASEAEALVSRIEAETEGRPGTPVPAANGGG